MHLPSRRESMARHRAAGGRVAAVLPVHAPRPLLRAHGYLPVEVWGPPGADPDRAGAHLPPWVCSVARLALAFLRSDPPPPVDLVVVPHTCDAFQGLGSLLRDLLPPGVPVLTPYVPRHAGAGAAHYLAAELQDLDAALAATSGHRPDPDEILAHVLAEEAADRALADLLAARPDLALDDPTFYRLARSREYLPAEAFAAGLIEALAAPPAPAPGIPLLLSGIVPEPRALLEVLHRAGGRVVADDLAAVGRRAGPPGTGDDPFLRMAERLLAAAPDSTRGSDLHQRTAHLRDLCRRTGVRGAVFLPVRSCSPELLHLPLVRRALEDDGIRTLALEVDLTTPLPEQSVTRLEAFLEGLG